MSAVLKGCFDGSAGAQKYLSLAGFSGSSDAWTDLETRWQRAVSPWKAPRSGPTFNVWHSSEAFASKGEFSSDRGWTEKEANRVCNAIFRDCLMPVCTERRAEFCASSATVDLEQYGRACGEFSDLRQVKPPEALLVDLVVSQGLSLLPWTESGDWYDGKIELYFDRNERFRRQVEPVYRRGAKHRVGGLIAHLGLSSSADSIALQATDLVGWMTNRIYTGQKDRTRYSMMLKLMLSLRHKLFEYDDIVASYQRAKDAMANADASRAP